MGSRFTGYLCLMLTTVLGGQGAVSPKIDPLADQVETHGRVQHKLMSEAAPSARFLMSHMDAPGSPMYKKGQHASHEWLSALQRTMVRADLLGQHSRGKQVVKTEGPRAPQILRGRSSSQRKSTSTVALSPSPASGPTAYGGVIYPGFTAGLPQYYTDLYLGTPAQHMQLIIDTGSDLVWSQSLPPFDPHKSSTYSNVTCGQDTCHYFHLRVDFGISEYEGYETVKCFDSSYSHYMDYSKNTNKNCGYRYTYVDSTTTYGHLATDVVHSVSKDGQSIHTWPLHFGCSGATTSAPGEFVFVGGILGLGPSFKSFSGQMTEHFGGAFTTCLTGRETALTNVGVLEFGSTLPPGITYAPLGFDDYSHDLWEVNVLNCSLGTIHLPIPSVAWIPTIFDTGSLFSIVSPQIHQEIVAALLVLGELFTSPLRLDHTGLVCYHIQTKSAADLDILFPPLEFDLGGDAPFLSTGQQYVVRKNSSTVVDGVNVLGSLHQQNRLMIWDEPKKRIGWTTADCNARVGGFVEAPPAPPVSIARNPPHPPPFSLENCQHLCSQLFFAPAASPSGSSGSYLSPSQYGDYYSYCPPDCYSYLGSPQGSAGPSPYYGSPEGSPSPSLPAPPVIAAPAPANGTHSRSHHQAPSAAPANGTHPKGHHPPEESGNSTRIPGHHKNCSLTTNSSARNSSNTMESSPSSAAGFNDFASEYLRWKYLFHATSSLFMLLMLVEDVCWIVTASHYNTSMRVAQRFLVDKFKACIMTVLRVAVLLVLCAIPAWAQLPEVLPPGLRSGRRFLRHEDGQHLSYELKHVDKKRHGPGPKSEHNGSAGAQHAAGILRSRARAQRVGRRVAAAALAGLTAAAEPFGGGEDKPAAATAVPLSVEEGFYQELYPGFDLGLSDYFVNILIGTPPQKVQLTMDTGSDLTWTQCQPCVSCYQQALPIFRPAASSSFATLQCGHASCAALADASNACKSSDASAAAAACTYEYGYGDGSQTSGQLASDMVVLEEAGGQLRSVSLVMGCGDRNTGIFSVTGGLIGMGKGALSFTQQVRSIYGRIFTTCLVTREDVYTSHGYLSFGRRLVPVAGVTYTPLAHLDEPGLDTYYMVDVAGVSFGGRQLVLPTAALAVTIFDTGSTLSTASKRLYGPVAAAVEAAAPSAPFAFRGYQACYEVPTASQAELDVYFPPLALHLSDGGVYTMTGQQYMVRYSAGIACLGMLEGADNANIIGNIGQQNTLLVWDVEANQLGWMPGVDCHSSGPGAVVRLPPPPPSPPPPPPSPPPPPPPQQRTVGGAPQRLPSKLTGNTPTSPGQKKRHPAGQGHRPPSQGHHDCVPLNLASEQAMLFDGVVSLATLTRRGLGKPHHLTPPSDWRRADHRETSRLRPWGVWSVRGTRCAPGGGRSAISKAGALG
eukprot:SM000169S02729  [mRNA]  locus=s169:298210:312206:- [translate_table: standard]